MSNESTVAFTRQDQLEVAWHQILGALPVNIKADGLKDTPARAARALLELTAGYDAGEADIEALFRTFERDGYDEMIVLRDIDFASLCEHHVLPFTGQAHIAYIPTERVVGLSKLARVVEAYSRRLQIQERLTVQIADALNKYLQPKGVMVVVEATHTCMTLRGIRKPGAIMCTSAIRGVMMKPEVRAEALDLLFRQ